MSSPSRQPVRILGRYALYGELASGGMATVHYGRLTGPVGFSRTVAIKRLHAHYAKDPEFVSMFLDEARLAARIRHPNVVPTLDVVALDGELFLVMEYIQGESLSRLLREARRARQPVPREILAAIVVGALNGLHAAHEATNERGEPLDIVHRDVSPQNILVGSDGIPRLLDFGVAKAAGSAHSTRDGQIKGKIPYMAPEQIRGRVTRSTDVYASGVVLWEGLTGRRLFSGESEPEIMAKVLDNAIDAPSKYAPEIPAALDQLVVKALARDPKERFATAREMARALEKSVPLVSASDVGDWVEATARAGLEERARQVASIENDSSVSTGVPATPLRSDLGPTPSSRMPIPPSAAAAAENTLFTEMSSASLTDPARGPFRRPSVIVGSMFGAVAILVVVLVGVLGMRSRDPARAASSASGVAAAASLPPAPTPTPTPAPAPAPTSALAAPPAEPAASVVELEPAPAVTASAAPAIRPAAATKPGPRPTPTGKGYGSVLDSRR